MEFKVNLNFLYQVTLFDLLSAWCKFWDSCKGNLGVKLQLHLQSEAQEEWKIQVSVW